MRHGLLWVALVAVAPLAAQDSYGGPSVLSRGPVGNLSGSSDLLVLQPSLQLLGSYESGLYLPSVDSLGHQVGSGGSFGVTASAAVNGYHRWKRTVLGLNYQGNFRHYTRNPYLDGIDQTVSLNVQRQTSARTRVGVSGAGGEEASYPWRFWLDGEATVSAYRPGKVRPPKPANRSSDG